MVDECDVDVCVVGAGPVGGALACRLGRAGVSVAVVDRAELPPMEHPDFDGRAYAIAAGSRALLESAGLWSALPLPVGPIREIRVSDGRLGRRPSRMFLHFGAAEVGSEAFGWMVEARSLRMALNAALHALPSVRMFAPASARVSFSAAGAEVAIAGGPTVSCRLVVAAEGRESPLRTQAGIGVTRFAYRQAAMVGAVEHERPHNGIALEHFLPAGPFAQLPMAGSDEAPNLSAYVWTERAQAIPRYLALDDAAFARELTRRLGGHLGRLRVRGRRWHYGLGALHAHRYVAERLALVGDAAHGIHPIAGQGLNLGFRDIDALSRLVEAACASGEDPGSPVLLRRYQARRRPDNLLMLAATDGLDRLFSTDAPPLRLARDVGLAAVHRLGPLKRAFMRQAMGAVAR